MEEVRPGLTRVRKKRQNKLQMLKDSVIEEKTKLETDITEKYERGEKAVYELQDFASSVSGYVDALRERGIDTTYIRENADQIRTIFFAVLELIENGHKGFDEKAEEAAQEKE